MTLNVRSHLSSASRLMIMKLENGWIINLPDCEVPIACATPADVILHVVTFVGGRVTPVAWQYEDRALDHGDVLSLLKIDGGYLFSKPTQMAPGQVLVNPSALAFDLDEVVAYTGRWLCLLPDFTGNLDPFDDSYDDDSHDHED